VTDIEAAARLLHAARTDSTTIAALPEEARPISVAEGYAIQDRLAALCGEATLGWKVGAWGSEIQARLGVDEPFSGRYQKPFVVEHPAVLGWERFATRPGLECEVAVRLGRDLTPTDTRFTPASVADALDALVPAIEIVCGRFAEPMRSGAPSLVADNGMSGYLVVGDPVAIADAPPPEEIQATLRINGDTAAEGDLAGAGIDLAEVVAWLANHLAERGIALPAGTLISTG
jgi:2-keto-4-pentenoate hydratase